MMNIFEPKIDKNDIQELQINEKVRMGKDIEKMMNMEKERLGHQSQVLKDRMEIQE